MDAPLRKCDVAAREAVTGKRPDERLEVLVRVAGSARSHRGAMQEIGLELHSTTGPIASGVISAGDVVRLAALPFVRRIELTRALYSED